MREVAGTSPRQAYRLYDAVAQASAALVIDRYSSSFGMASRLLGGHVRVHVRNVYALVRLADEIVDIPDPGLPREVRATMLESLHDDVRRSLRTGYSANLIVHAFVRTALAVGIEEDLIDPFFASMRMDLDVSEHSQESFDRYVYGSAEVVGLMCLRVFVTDASSDPDLVYARLSHGAQRLGAAFQKLNFLRDLGADRDSLHRSYFPGVDADRLTDADRDRILDDIDADLSAAASVIPQLPHSSRRAVSAAHATFAELAARLRTTPAAEIRHRRVRVPNSVKLRLLAASLIGARG